MRAERTPDLVARHEPGTLFPDTLGCRRQHILAATDARCGWRRSGQRATLAEALAARGRGFDLATSCPLRRSSVA